MPSSPAACRRDACARRDLRGGGRTPTTPPRAAGRATAASSFTLCLATDTSREGQHGLSVGENPVPAGAGRRLRRLVHLLVVPPSLRGRDARVRALAR